MKPLPSPRGGGWPLSEDADKTKDFVLPSGVDPDKLAEAIRASGYPLQTVVARQLHDNFNVVEEWGYVDRTSQEHRSLDLFAHRRLSASSERLQVSLTLLVECKRSDLPYVFFAAAIPRIPSDLPVMVGFPKRTFDLYQGTSSFREVSPADFLRCREFAFVADPPLAVTFSRVERNGKGFSLSGDVPYKTVILPLASALEHYQDSRKGVQPTQECFHPSLAVCVCVLDAPIVLARGTPEFPELSTTSWVRVAREEALRDGNWWRRKHYYIDVVQRQFLDEYVSGHLIPFSEQVASRMTENERLVLAGKGQVASWDNWTWNDMRPVGS